MQKSKINTPLIHKMLDKLTIAIEICPRLCLWHSVKRSRRLAVGGYSVHAPLSQEHVI